MKVEDILSGGSKRRNWRKLRGSRHSGPDLKQPKQTKQIGEGGNVFQDTVSFTHEHIPEIMSAINSVLSDVGVKAIPIGSGANPRPGKLSGDLDMIIDLDDMPGQESPADARRALRAMFDAAGFETSQTGVSVHVRVPLHSEAYQVDLMVVANGQAASRFHKHRIPDQSKYKGRHKHIAMAALAKQKDMLWSPYQGLFSRDELGKKGEFITIDPDQVAQYLLSPDATEKDLGSMESILAALSDDARANLILTLNQDPNWSE
jgi:hypothetical protein